MKNKNFSSFILKILLGNRISFNKLSGILLNSLLILTMIFNTALSQSGWVQQSSNTTNRLLSISFINTNTGFIAGGIGTIIKTTNGGENWFNVVSPGGISIDYYNIFMASDNIIITAGSSGIVFRSTDSGLNWTSVLSTSGGVNGMSFVSSQKGWITSGGYIYRTTNAGVNWAQFGLVGTRAALDMKFGDSLTGYAYGAYLQPPPNPNYNIINWIQKSSNAGESWSTIFTYTSQGQPLFGGLFFKNGNTGYLGEWGNMRKTTNGGNTWTIYQAGLNPFLESILFLDDTLGWVTSHSGISRSTNGGANWTSVLSGQFDFVFFIDYLTGWVCGEAGLVYKTTTGGITYSKNLTNSIPADFKLEQNYPNPFNSSTKIRFELPKGGNVKLDIYDILGREITRIINNKYRTAGGYITEFNSSNLSSGIYFYSLQVNDGKDFRAVKKMVYIK